jgi:hypothetical protein
MVSTWLNAMRKNAISCAMALGQEIVTLAWSSVQVWVLSGLGSTCHGCS